MFRSWPAQAAKMVDRKMAQPEIGKAGGFRGAKVVDMNSMHSCNAFEYCYY